MNTELALFLAKAVGFLIALAVAIWAIIYVGTFAITVFAGVLGLLCVKTRYPLMNPNGPVIVTALYAVIWGTAITLALYLGSMLLNEVRGLPNPLQRAHGILFKDAPLFLVQAVWVLFAAARLSKKNMAQTDPERASAIFCALAAVIFSISSEVLSVSNVMDGALVIAKGVASTVFFPIEVVARLASNQQSFLADTVTWLKTTDANLFKLSSYISKILWMVAILKLLRYLVTNDKEERAVEPTSTYTMTRGEALRFLGTLASFSVLATLIVISLLEEAGHLRFRYWLDNPFLTVFLVYAVVWGFLYRSRLQA